MNPNSSNILPLEALLERLELAGFHLSPARRMRAITVLDQMGRLYINEPKRVKYLLAPVLARDANEQQKFYEIFDQFWVEITTPPPPIPIDPLEEVPPPPFVKWLWFIPALILASLVYIFWPQKEIPVPHVFFETKNEVAEGDSVHVILFTENLDSSQHDFSWTYLDSFSNKKSRPLFSRKDKDSWSIVMDHPGEKKGRKFLQLEVSNVITEQKFNHQQEIRLKCLSAPEIEGRFTVARANAKEVVVFDVQLKEPEKFQYEWQFGDDETSNQKYTQHRYQENGVYTIRLRVWDPAHTYPCESIAEQQISIGPEKAYLPLRMLAFDQVKPFAFFTQLYWLFLGFLGISALYWIGRWVKRPFPPDPAERKREQLSATFAKLDQAPYFIPFRSQNEKIIVSNELYRLAMVLRQREEGVGKKIDIKGTINRTIQGGGFPEIALASRTQPTEYLVLIDEKAPESHQTRLFTYLVNLLKDQDVLVQVFRYHENFNWFWDDDHPKGISAQNLNRMYPHHRLLVMGDAHALLDPFAKDKPELREKEERFIRQWQYRLLFTPLPQVSWTYREKVLYRLFYCFSADTEGLESAAGFLESLAWEEDSPPAYERWVKHLNFQSDPDTNYRRWRRLKDHQEYLSKRPDLLPWLCALAVSPKPRWETTVAIGKALGAEVSYDNLLILSRIPWLQNGELTPRLQAEFLEHLSNEHEKLAREALLEELTSVQKICKEGFANLELKSGIAIQAFALQPQAMATQEQLRFLIDQKLLNKKQIAELNGQLNRQQTRKAAAEQFTVAPPVLSEQVNDIHDFLDKNKEEPEKPNRPFYTKEWYYSAASSAVFLLLLLSSLALNKTDRLYDLAFGELPVASVEHADRELQSRWGLIGEKQAGNPAAILNNEAVSSYETMLNFIYRDGIKLTKENEITLKANQLGIANRKLTEAIDKYPDYTLAKDNLNRIRYNQAVEAYNDYLTNGSEQPELLTRIFYWENPYLSESLRLDVLHGAGLCFYYNNQIDTAQLLLDKIETLSDRQYFDTLSNFPNLRSILFRSQPPLHISGQIYSKDNRQGLSGVSVTVVDPQLLTAGYTIAATSDNKGEFELDFPAGYRPAKTLLRYTRRPYQTQDLAVVFNSDSVKIKVELTKEEIPETVLGTENPQVDTPTTTQSVPEVEINGTDAYNQKRSELIKQLFMSSEAKQFEARKILEEKFINDIQLIPDLLDSSKGKVSRQYSTSMAHIIYLISKIDKQLLGAEKERLNNFFNELERANLIGTQTKYIIDQIKESISSTDYKTGSYTDPRDNQSYATITINKQEWLAENIRYQVPGSECYSQPTQSQSCTQFYTYDQALQACPNGWRLPSIRDWTQLIDQLEIDFARRGLGKEDRATAAYAGMVPGGFSGLNIELEGYLDKSFKGKRNLYGQGDVGRYWSSSKITNIESLSKKIKGQAIYHLVLNGDVGRVYEETDTEDAEMMSCRCVR